MLLGALVILVSGVIAKWHKLHKLDVCVFCWFASLVSMFVCSILMIGIQFWYYVHLTVYYMEHAKLIITET